jgi:hypothetical protein
MIGKRNYIARFKLAWRVWKMQPTLCWVHAIVEDDFLLHDTTLGRITVTNDPFMVTACHFEGRRANTGEVQFFDAFVQPPKGPDGKPDWTGYSA